MVQKLIRELNEQNATLVAVSKTQPIEALQIIYNAGHRIFGENRVQELVHKYEVLPKDIQWHFIGHLQSKKVKQIAPFINLIHSIDSLKLLQEVNKQALKNDRIIDCLLQFKIAIEDTKYGMHLTDAEQFFSSPDFLSLKNIRIVGIMGMASFVSDELQVREEFKQLKQIFDQLKNTYFSDIDAFKELSMGMSGDYKIALEEGSTMVRIGSLLFGRRYYG